MAITQEQKASARKPSGCFELFVGPRSMLASAPLLLSRLGWHPSLSSVPEPVNAKKSKNPSPAPKKLTSNERDWSILTMDQRVWSGAGFRVSGGSWRC